jgi:Fungal Zn(2)-Cys(6) binuclear cluster domain
MHSDNASQPKSPSVRKGMRKGTHSCFECRKRKVRCIFAKDSTVCESCVARGKRCTEQRRELLQEAALDTRESLRERIARLEAIIRASGMDGDSVTVDQISSSLELNLRDTQPGRIRTEFSSSSIASNPTPASTPPLNESVSIDKDSHQNIDPLVTLFDNAIVSLIVYSKLCLLRSRIVEATKL